MFARCLKWPGRLLGLFLRSVRPQLYVEENAFLGQAAEARSMAEVRGLVESWRYEVGVRQRGRSWWFDIVPRPSGRRMLTESRALFEAVRQDTQPDGHRGPAGLPDAAEDHSGNPTRAT